MGHLADSLLLDCRHALRAIRRRPAFAVAAVGVLAAGIGATAAIFAVVHAAFLGPLPYPRPEELVWLDTREPSGAGEPAQQALSALHFSRWREERRTFATVGAYSPRTISLVGRGEPEPLRGAVVSAGLFDLLGVSPILGRGFTREEERAGSGVAIIGYALWRRRFGGDPRIVGRTVLLDEEPRVIIGVMPRDFAPAMQPGDIWIPVELGPEELAPQRARLRVLIAIGRLRPGVSVAQATDASNVIVQGLAREIPDVHRFTRASVTPLREQLYGAHRGSLVLIFSAVLLLFLLACVNLASVSMSNALARAPEAMMRRALGASVAHLVRIRLIESLLIAGVGALAGVGVTSIVLAWLRSEFPTVVERYGDLVVDPIVVTTATALALVATVAMALPASLPDLRAASRELRLSGSRIAGSPMEHRLRAVMLGAQVALTLVLLTGAGLLLRGFERLMQQGSGISSERVLTFQFHPSRRAYTTPPQRAAYVERLLRELSALPDVVSAGSTQASFGAAESMQSSFEIEGRPAGSGELLATNIRHVTPGYFTTLRVPMRAGRPFTDADRAGAPVVAVVSESFARRFWPGESAIGKRLRRGGPVVRWMEVVGIAADVRDAGLSTSAVPTFYVSYLQQNTPTARVTVLLRARTDPALLAASARRVVRSIDPNQVMDFVFPLDRLLTRSVAIQRLQSALLTMFAAGGLTVALVGLYGLASFGVARRTREIGIRAALGARRRQVLALVLGDALRPVAIGVGIGLALSVTLAGYVNRLFPELASSDPLVFGVAATGLLLAAGAAALLPSARALRIDPARTLREE
ncbi:MAG TPA: ABC transporter permease [Gemmatimonadaceae bacterium]|nr:ABC transporter permease [Gemmatimonadaceae bacterium]